MMNLNGLSKHFGSLLALDNASLDIVPGTVTSLLGPSGSGKSTFLRCMNLLEIPDSGSMSFDGRTLEFRPHHRPKVADVQHVRCRTGMIFQNFQLFPHLNARDNICIGLETVRRMDREGARQKARAALDRVGLSDKEASFPSQLSGGQQQRVAIARALAMEPQLLLCDEPTSALDPELAVEVIDVLSSLAREGTTMVIATHDLRLARNTSHHILFLEGGRIVEAGSPEELFHRPRMERTRAFLSTLDTHERDLQKPD